MATKKITQIKDPKTGKFVKKKKKTKKNDFRKKCIQAICRGL